MGMTGWPSRAFPNQRFRDFVFSSGAEHVFTPTAVVKMFICAAVALQAPALDWDPIMSSVPGFTEGSWRGERRLQNELLTEGLQLLLD